MATPNPATQLKELTALKSCPACVAIVCPDWVRRDRAVEYLLKHFTGTTRQPPTFSFSESGRGGVANILNTLATPSLFDPHRFALIKGVEHARAAELEPISRFISAPPSDTHLLICAAQLPNSPNFKKALQSHATLLTFEPLKGAELTRWTERELKNHGISAAPDDVVALLLSLAAEEPAAITKLIEKFTLFLDGAPATSQQLLALSPGRSHASDFELADTLLLADRASGESLLLQLINQGSSPFMLMGLLAKTLANLYHIRIQLDRSVHPNDIRSELAIPPWFFTKYLATAKRLSRSRIERTLDALLMADYRLKDYSLGPASIFSSVAFETHRDA
jgi:DNA polymerase III delta subunit